MRDIRKISVGLVLTLYVAFGHDSFVKGAVVLFTQELAGWSAHTDFNDLWLFGRLVCVTEINRTAARTEERI